MKFDLLINAMSPPPWLSDSSPAPSLMSKETCKGQPVKFESSDVASGSLRLRSLTWLYLWMSDSSDTCVTRKNMSGFHLNSKPLNCSQVQKLYLVSVAVYFAFGKAILVRIFVIVDHRQYRVWKTKFFSRRCLSCLNRYFIGDDF